MSYEQTVDQVRAYLLQRGRRSSRRICNGRDHGVHCIPHASTRPPFITADMRCRAGRCNACEAASTRPPFITADMVSGQKLVNQRRRQLQRGRRSSRRIWRARVHGSARGGTRFNEAAVHHGGYGRSASESLCTLQGFNEAAVHHGGYVTLRNNYGA